MHGGLGNWLMVIGIVLLLGGILVKTGLLGWLGNLPGDITIRRQGFRFYFPITSMILVSVALSLIVSLIRRFF